MPHAEVYETFEDVYESDFLSPESSAATGELPGDVRERDWLAFERPTVT
jgi:hypothetical protein